MKNLTFLLLGGLLFLASCSTGNMASFSKRKYTKGKYKPEKNDYKVAKSNNKSEDTKYVVKTEKNKNNQKYKVTKKKEKKTQEVAAKTNNKKASNEIEIVEEEPYVAENRTGHPIVEDKVIENKSKTDKEVVKVDEKEENANTPSPNPTPSTAGEILGYIGFGFGLLAVLLAVLGWLTLGLAYAALALGIIGLGTSIASWVIDGQSIWNLWGTITSAVAILLAIIFMILWFIIFI